MFTVEHVVRMSTLDLYFRLDVHMVFWRQLQVIWQEVD